MKAFIVDRYKKKGALRFGDMPEPALRDDDVLVEIHAAGLNLLDSKIRDGEFKPSCRIARPSSWGTTWPERSSASDRMSGASSRATRSMLDHAIAGSEHSRNSLP